MILIAFNISHTQNTKGHSGSEKTFSSFTQNFYFPNNHRISFDTKGPISPSSEGNSYIMVIVDEFTHYVALNPVPHCNAYYALYTG